jgi:hypothetical protein
MWNGYLMNLYIDGFSRIIIASERGGCLMRRQRVLTQVQGWGLLIIAAPWGGAFVALATRAFPTTTFKRSYLSNATFDICPCLTTKHRTIFYYHAR